MIETDNPEINVDEIMNKIRSEIDAMGNKEKPKRIGENNFQPQLLEEDLLYMMDLKLERLNLHAPFEHQPDGVYRLGDLVQYRDLVFVENAYKVIFHREPDPAGSEYYLNLLTKGTSKVELIGRLRFSSEGREVGTHIKGLMAPFILSQLFKIPVIGFLLHVAASIIRLPQIQKNLRQFENHSAALHESTRNHLNQSFDELESRISLINKALRNINNSVSSHGERLGSFEEKLNVFEEKLNVYDSGHSERLKNFIEKLATYESDIKVLRKKVSYFKVDLVMQERRIGILLEEARTRLPEPLDTDQLKRIAKEGTYLLDPLYLAFEDQFRGTKREIKDRSKVYLPVLKQVNAGIPKRPLLDVGSGRGEWLELLKEEDLTAQGVDLSKVLVEQCNDGGLAVKEAEAIEYLQRLPASSLGAITAFHFIEHLQFEELIAFLDASLRVLLPEGIAIFETPNPENILVGAHSFYLDPMHRNPLPPQLMKFLVESRGFCRVEIKYLHPYGKEAYVEENSDVAKKFNQYFYGPQDYAVIGYKV